MLAGGKRVSRSKRLSAGRPGRWIAGRLGSGLRRSPGSYGQGVGDFAYNRWIVLHTGRMLACRLSRASKDGAGDMRLRPSRENVPGATPRFSGEWLGDAVRGAAGGPRGCDDPGHNGDPEVFAAPPSISDGGLDCGAGAAEENHGN